MAVEGFPHLTFRRSPVPEPDGCRVVRHDGLFVDICGVGPLSPFVVLILAALAGFAGQARDKAEQWRNATGEWPGRAGWHLVAQLAMQDADLPDAYFLARLDDIEREIHTRKNRVRDAMNNALIAIGLRSPALEPPALAAAARLGKVVVDHGPTGCKTPDAAAYIHRALSRRQKKATR